MSHPHFRGKSRRVKGFVGWHSSNGKPKASGKTELSLAGLSVSSEEKPNREIPLDVIGVISQFLAGDFAFGTLASLNVANHGIRDETLPILYETVCLDNIKNLPHYGGGGSKVPRPTGFKYTKYYLCTHQDGVVLLNLTSLFPNLVMTIKRSTKYMGDIYNTSYNEFTVCLYKPVTTATAFGTIFRTPMHHEPFPHNQYCRRSGLAVIGSLKMDCDKDTRPLLRAPETVRYFYLADGAYLTNTDAVTRGGVSPKWTTNVRMEDACFVHPLMIEDQTPAHIDTIVELVKLPQRYHDTRALRALDNRLALEHTQNSLAPKCQGALKYCQWHLSLNMSATAAGLLAKSLIPAILVNSDMLRPRLKIFICSILDKFVFGSVFDTFGSLYGIGDSPTRFLSGVCRYLPEVGPRHTFVAMSTAYGNPDGTDGLSRRRYLGYLRFSREKGSSALLFSKKILMDVEPPGQTLIDSNFGDLDDGHDNRM